MESRRRGLWMIESRSEIGRESMRLKGEIGRCSVGNRNCSPLFLFIIMMILEEYGKWVTSFVTGFSGLTLLKRNTISRDQFQLFKYCFFTNKPSQVGFFLLRLESQIQRGEPMILFCHLRARPERCACFNPDIKSGGSMRLARIRAQSVTKTVIHIFFFRNPLANTFASKSKVLKNKKDGTPLPSPTESSGPALFEKN